MERPSVRRQISIAMRSTAVNERVLGVHRERSRELRRGPEQLAHSPDSLSLGARIGEPEHDRPGHDVQILERHLGDRLIALHFHSNLHRRYSSDIAPERPNVLDGIAGPCRPRPAAARGVLAVGILCGNHHDTLSESSRRPHFGQMLRLLTLGGATIVDESGERPGSAASQRRSLALLAVLAVSDRVGLSRDKLVALFWPEADTDRGRHALTQALYAARRGLACEDLFVVGPDVRLNPERITSDVQEFEAAMATDPEQAVSLYRGPFLDGFYLPGAGEFEQWSSAQRARIEAQVLDALERLATSATETADARRAAEWWRRAVVLRPLDSGLAMRYMQSLAAAGDRAGALRHAALHRSLLRSELDLEPDAHLVELESALREPELEPDSQLYSTGGAGPAASSPVPVRPAALRADAVEELAAGTQLPRGAGAATLEANIPPARPYHPVQVWAPSQQRGRRWRRSWPLAALLLAGIVLAGAGVAIGIARRESRTVRPLPVRQAVVVAPFRVAGASSSLRYLRDGMVELLSTRLADDSAARSVDAGAVIGAWNAAALAPDMDVPRDQVVRLASRLGAERVVVGDIVGTPRALVVHATVLRVPGGAVAAEATVQGSADSITSVVDGLAARLLLSEAGEDARLANHMTSSLAALRAFLGGQAALRANDYSTAVRDFDRSLAGDSTFALAALRLAIVADRMDDALLVRRGLRTAWAFRDELVERDRALLLGFTGTRFPAPPLARDQAYEWQRATDLAPASADAWLALGGHLFHEGAIVDAPDRWNQARIALRRALLLDSTNATAARLLGQLSTSAGPSAGPTTGAAGAITVDSTNVFAPFMRWHAAALSGDSVALHASRATLQHLGPVNLRTIAMASQFDATGLDDATRAITTLRERHPSGASRVDALLGAHALALNEGRMRDAARAAAQLRTQMPGSHAGIRLALLDAIYGQGEDSVARSAAAELESLVLPLRADSLAPGATRASDLCVLGQWWLSHGRSASVPTLVAELHRAGAADAAAPVSAGPAACAELLDVGMAVAARRADARARVARLDSLAFTPETAGDAAAYAPLWIAQLHEAVGDWPGALRAVRRRQYMADWPRYLASMLREEGRLAQHVSDIPTAREAYRRYLVLRAEPDTSIAPQVDSVRQAAVRLADTRAH